MVGGIYQINGHPFTIIGVAPPDFLGAKVADSNMPDFWLPLPTEPLIASATSRLENPRSAWLFDRTITIPARSRTIRRSQRLAALQATHAPLA